MIKWERVDKNNPPKGTLIFFFDGSIYTGWPLFDSDEQLDERDDDGYPIWEENNGSRTFYGVRWYASFNYPPNEID